MGHKNIFEIWKANGKKIPFAVRRWNWPNQYYTIVTGIRIKKWPYGDAYGYPTSNGIYSNHYETYDEWNENKIIPNAGSYQWSLVDSPQISEDDIQRFKPPVLVKRKKGNRKKPNDTYQVTYQLIQEELSVEEIADRRGLKIGTIYSHIEVLISRGFILELEKYVLQDKQIQILNAAEQLKPEKIKELKDFLGDDYSYDEIRLTLASHPKSN